MQPIDTLRLLGDPSGVADCPGFSIGTAAADIRGNGGGSADLCLVRAEQPCPGAGVFTRNDVVAAPVRFCRETLAANADAIGGWVANSGNANAWTGARGDADAREMAATAQNAANADAPFLVCSTGRIGRALPMDRIRTALPAAAPAAETDAEASLREASLRAADSILTSDTARKLATARFEANGREVTVAGMAKGAGMIEPDMATMLAFLVSDFAAPADLLHATLADACDRTFNRISIDGDMSTNDTVLLLANGRSGIGGDTPGAADAFREAVFRVCDALAEKIVGDGEKVTKLVELVVEGAASDADAEKVARAVGNSLLVKSSWYGADPNWGRIADAAGYAGAGLREDALDLHYDDVPALIGGMPREENTEQWRAIVARNRFRVTLNLNRGAGRFRLLTTDLSEAYVAFNKSE